MNTSFCRVLALGAALAFSGVLRAEPALLANSGLKGQSLDAEGVKAVLLGKRVTLGGTRVVIVIAKSGDAQDRFLQQYVGMTTSQFQNYWRRLFMTGGGTAPKMAENDDEARKVASATAGAVVIADKDKADGLCVLASGS